VPPSFPPRTARLGRPFLAIADNSLDALELFETHVQLDIEGNPLVVTDANNIATETNEYAPGGLQLHTLSPDAANAGPSQRPWQPLRPWCVISMHSTSTRSRLSSSNAASAAKKGLSCFRACASMQPGRFPLGVCLLVATPFMPRRGPFLQILGAEPLDIITLLRRRKRAAPNSIARMSRLRVL
jgi:hypothetical protein